MGITGGSRTKAAATGALMLTGLTMTLAGLIDRQSTQSLAGIVISMVALTCIILATVHKWVTDTSTERTILAAAQREAQAERTRYIAAQAALENEQARLHRDLAAERAALTERSKAERAALVEEFEERRAGLIAETMEATVLMFRDGKFDPQLKAGNLIRFPRQHPQPGPVTQSEHSREHEVVGP